jgi:hypothetical protein
MLQILKKRLDSKTSRDTYYKVYKKDSLIVLT